MVFTKVCSLPTAVVVTLLMTLFLANPAHTHTHTHGPTATSLAQTRAELTFTSNRGDSTSEYLAPSVDGTLLLSLQRSPLKILARPSSAVSVIIKVDAKPARTVEVQSGADGVATVWVKAFKWVEVTAANGSELVHVRLKVAPTFQPVRVNKSAPLPKREITDPPAVSLGANTKVTRVSVPLRETMTGISWRNGCVPFSELREVRTNYIDTAGYVREGKLVVRADVATKVAELFTQAYTQGYRFHSIHPVDAYGLNPKGPGADDYASMRAGNTSAFNCRYVVGGERQKRISPHWAGRALDINPLENPYVSPTGTYPNGFYVSHARRQSSPLGLTQRSPLVLTARTLGWSWGGSYNDFHHFDYIK